MQTLRIVNYVIALIFTICYAYQFFYIPVVLFRKKIFRRKEKAAAQGTAAEKACEFAVLICARNEEAVIGDLLASIRRQTYPAEHIHVFVMADNCTDGTAMAARKGGAVVYTRSDSRQIGKGYALDLLLRNIRRDHPEGFDGYFVFDADNLLRPDYIEKMKDTYLAGNDIITSYRNSKITEATGSPPDMRSGSCVRAGISTTREACFLPAAPFPGQGSFSAGRSAKRWKAGRTIC